MTDDQFEEMMRELQKHTTILNRIADLIEDTPTNNYSGDLDDIKNSLTRIDNTLGFIESNTTP